MTKDATVTPADPSTRDAGDAGDAVTVDPGLRIGDAAARAGVSTRTLRYYEELGLLAPSGYTAGGERRYHAEDMAQLERIIELRDVLGMNLDDIKSFLTTEHRLDDLRAVYRERRSHRSTKAQEQQREILKELLRLHEALIERLDTKLQRMTEFRSELAGKAQRCRQLLAELEQPAPQGSPKS